MIFAKVDVSIHSHPRFVAAGFEASGYWVAVQSSTPLRGRIARRGCTGSRPCGSRAWSAGLAAASTKPEGNSFFFATRPAAHRWGGCSRRIGAAKDSQDEKERDP